MEETQLKEEVNSLHKLVKTQVDPLILTTRLYDATIKGDINSLHNLLQEDPLILDKCIIQKSNHFFMQSPLHVAANLGHLEFTTQLLHQNPELAKQLDDLTTSSALHLASEKGHLDIVIKLVQVMPKMCFVRDQYGLNPAHVAAITNQLHVLDFLVRNIPNAAQERTNDNQTLLHLCVKYAQLECLKYSVNALGELLNAKDNDGNTVLHFAVLAKQPQAVKLLVSNKKMHLNAINKNGLTAIDCVIQNGKSQNDDEIHRTLRRAKALKAKHVETQKIKDGKWLNKQRNALMVVASLIATMAFQLGVNPPQGTWENDNSYFNDIYLIITPFYAVNVRVNFDNLMIANTVSLTSSLSVVLLLIGGLPCKRLFVIVLMITMWVAISATLLTYFIALVKPTNPQIDDGILILLGYASFAWAILVTILLLGHILRVLVKPVKKLVQLVKRGLCKWTCCGNDSIVVHHNPLINTSLSSSSYSVGNGGP